MLWLIDIVWECSCTDGGGDGDRRTLRVTKQPLYSLQQQTVLWKEDAPHTLPPSCS